jgi:replicative DNA helicase
MSASALDFRRREPAADPEMCGAPRSALALIGCVLAEPSRLREVAHVRPEHFAQVALAAIWRAIGDAAGAGQTPDSAGLFDAVAHLPEVAEIGGPAGLFDAFDNSGDPALARQHAARVLDAYARREGAGLCSAAARALMLQEGQSAPALIADVRRELEALERGAGEPAADLRTAAEAAGDLCEALEAEAAHGRPRGCLTGLRCFDRRLRGLRPGHLNIVGARPSMGKSGLMRAAAYGAAARSPDQAFLIFSLEMDKRECAERALSAASFVAQDPVAYVEFGRGLDADQRRSLRALRASMPANVLIDDRSSVGLDDIARRVWAVRSRQPVGAVFVDYLQLMARPPSSAGRSETLILGEITRGLKTLAKDAETCVVLLSQLNRGVESRDDKRPQLSDLRDSGSIEQDANAVLFPYREVYYLERNEPKNGHGPEHRDWVDRLEDLRRRMDVICAKNRGGAVGTDRQAYWAEFDHVEDTDQGAA